jgi:hypothetical protein
MKVKASVPESRRLTPERLRAFAVRDGFDENDPLLMRAVETLEKFAAGMITPEEVDATFGPFSEAYKTKYTDAHK